MILYRYVDLELFLNELHTELTSINDIMHAELITRALAFRYGSPTEFLGESRIVLNKIIKDNPDLAKQTMSTVKFYINLINNGFDAVN